jgi:hypothetical protein
MSSDALFSLFSPVQSILFQRSNSTAWHGTPQPKPCRKGPVRAEAQGAEKESLADLLSRCCSALSAFSARKKILATMRDADGLQCRERGEKVLPKMQTSPTLQCKGAKIERITGYLTNDRRSVTWTGNGKIFFASLQCNNPNSLISDKTFSPRRTRRSRRQIDQKGLFNTSCPSCPSW